MDKTMALMVVDIVGSLVTYFVTRYLVPDAASQVLYVLGALQPLVIYVIKTWKDKEVALLDQGIDPKTRRSLK